MVDEVYGVTRVVHCLHATAVFAERIWLMQALDPRWCFIEISVPGLGCIRVYAELCFPAAAAAVGHPFRTTVNLALAAHLHILLTPAALSLLEPVEMISKTSCRPNISLGLCAGPDTERTVQPRAVRSGPHTGRAAVGGHQQGHLSRVQDVASVHEPDGRRRQRREADLDGVCVCVCVVGSHV